MCGHAGSKEIKRQSGVHQGFRIASAEAQATYVVKCPCGTTYMHTESTAADTRACAG
jgi:hypothetical protein